MSEYEWLGSLGRAADFARLSPGKARVSSAAVWWSDPAVPGSGGMERYKSTAIMILRSTL